MVLWRFSYLLKTMVPNSVVSWMYGLRVSMPLAYTDQVEDSWGAGRYLTISRFEASILFEQGRTRDSLFPSSLRVRTLVKWCLHGCLSIHIQHTVTTDCTLLLGMVSAADSVFLMLKRLGIKYSKPIKYKLLKYSKPIISLQSKK